jgi:hypothetical protein
MVLNKDRDTLQVSSSPKFVRSSAVISCLIWSLVLVKSVFSWLSSQSETHERVKSTYSRNRYLAFFVALLTVFKGYSELNSAGASIKLTMAKPDVIDSMYDYVKHSKTWNSTNEYGGYAYEWTKNKTSKWYDETYNSTTEWVASKFNATKVGDYKDQVIERFDEWVTQNVDIEKYAIMTKVAKKALWKEFIEQLDEEDGETVNDEPLLKQSPRV